jgi:hypothetical protein
VPEPPASGEPGRAAPSSVRWALAAIVGMQAAALVGYAALIVVEALRGDYQRTDFVAIEAALFAFWGVVLAVAARGLARGRRGGFAPVLLSELLLGLAVGLPLLRGGQVPLGSAVLVTAVVAVVLLVVTMARSPGE